MVNEFLGELKKYFTKPFFLAALICVFVFYSGIAKINSRYPFVSLLKYENLEEIYCKLVSSPVKSSSGKTYSATAQIFQCKDKRGVVSSATGRISILIPSEMVEVYYPGKLYSQSVEKGTWLYESGGFYVFSGSVSQDFFSVKKCSYGGFKNNLSGKIAYLRSLCRLQFKRLMFAWGNGGGLLLALLCGAREYTEDSVKDAFKNAGLSHILALSGMHLSMFSSIAVFFGKKIGRKKLTFIIRLVVLIIFVWFAGISPSLLRALISSMLIIFASMFSVEQPDMLLVLCFSFLLQCVISPADLTNAGFLLSYGALAGILLANKYFFRLYNRFCPFVIASSLGSSTAAQIFTAPISLKLFGSFCPIGIVATTFVSPLITVFIYAGLALIVLTLIFPPLCPLSKWIIEILYKMINLVTVFFSKAPAVHLT